MSVISAALNLISPNVETLERRVAQTKRDWDSEKVSAKTRRHGVAPESPEELDPSIIEAEREILYLEACEKYDLASPDRTARRDFLISELKAARDALARTDEETSAPVLKDVTPDALRAFADATARQLSAKAEREQRCLAAQHRLAGAIAAFQASGAVAAEGRKARGLPTGAMIVAHNDVVYLNALAHAAAHGKANAEEVKKVLERIEQPTNNGALYAAQIRLKELQARRERRVELAEERKRKAAEIAHDQRRLRGAGLIG